jgi:hypothetical protein
MECLLLAIYLASDSLDLEDLLSCHELLRHDASDGEHGKSVVFVCVCVEVCYCYFYCEFDVKIYTTARKQSSFEPYLPLFSSLVAMVL